MNKPNVSESTLSARFTEVQQHLKAIHLLLDSIQSEPYIPSIRQNGLAYLSDKVDNLQGNVHSMAMQLAHLGECRSGNRCEDYCKGCGCVHDKGANGPGCQMCM